MKPALLLLGIIIFYSCKTETPPDPKDAMKRYERLLLEMKADSISQMFTKDAITSHGSNKPVIGRDSIYAFLASFAKQDVIVLTNKDEIKSSAVSSDSAVLNGTYAQTVFVNHRDTVHVQGLFTARMIREKNEWLFTSMHTESINPGN